MNVTVADLSETVILTVYCTETHRFSILKKKEAAINRPIFFVLVSLLALFNSPRPSTRYREIGGGASNHNYLIENEQGTFFMRLSSEGGETLKNEFECSLIAEKLEIGPQIVSYHPDKNILITAYLSETLPLDLHDPAALKRAVAAIKKLHSSGKTFPRTSHPKQLVETLIKEAAENNIPLPPLALPEPPQNPYVNCHLDLHQGNILNDGQKIWLIDWEHAAASDPLFDLATLASTEHFSDEEMQELLNIYGSYELRDFKKMRALADARWAIWCYLREKTSSIDYPFAKEGDRFLESCLSQITSLEKAPSLIR